jgi:branched-chain amino acid transport system substrate-binding protein
MTSTTKILGLCLLCIVAVPWAVVAQASEVGVTDGDIQIAVFSSLSGPTSTEGRSFFEGARTFFEHVNRMGGIHGRSLTVLPHDMTGDPAGVVVAAHQMLKERSVFSMVVNSDTAATQSLLDQGIGDEPIPVLVG